MRLASGGPNAHTTKPPCRQVRKRHLLQSQPVSASEELSKILSDLKGEAVRVSLQGGELYDLEITSSSENRNDGTFDTTVIWAIKTPGPKTIETGARLKVNLDDVTKIEVLKNARCVFQRPVT
jgi:hypothetical protein